MKKFKSLFCILLIATTSVQAQSIKATDKVAREDNVTHLWGYENNHENTRNIWQQRAKKVSFGFLGIGGGNKNELLLQGYEDEWSISPQYENAAKYFSENLAGVQLHGKVGFIDPLNRFIIEPTFEPVKHLAGFNQGLAAVKLNDKFGFINKKGEFIIQPTFEYAENFKENLLATVKMDGKFGAINLKGEIVVPCKFIVEEAMIKVPFSNKPYRVAQEQALIDKNNGVFDELLDTLSTTGKAINKLIRDTLYLPACSYQPLLKTENEKNGLFNAKGDTLLPILYNDLIFIAHHLILTNKEDKWGASDAYGRCLLPCKYDFISYDPTARILLIQENGRTGLYSPTGMMILPPCLDGVDDFIEGKATVWMNYECGLMNTQGILTDSLLNSVFLKAAYLDEAGKTSDALALYKQILLAQPDYAMAHNNIGIMQIDWQNYNEGICRLKVAHKLEPENESIKENLKQAKKDRNQRRWNRVGTALEITAAVVGIAATTYATVESVKGSNSSPSYSPSGTSSSSGSGNCAFYSSEISKYEQKLASLNQSIGDKQTSATVKNTAHRISPDKVSGATGGDYRVINSSKSLAREYQKRIDQLKNDARKKGCL